MSNEIENQFDQTAEVQSAGRSSLPPVTIGVVNYNGLNYLERTFSAIFEIDYPDYDVMMVDNGSTDKSVEYVSEHFKDVQIFRTPTNRGPNAARNLALLNARSRYLFLLDNDAILTQDCLSKLVNILTSRNDAVTCSPLIVDSDKPDKVQYGVTHIHYIGAAILENTNGLVDKVSVTTTVNGTALLIDTERANKIGLFDEQMFFGWTDGDYSFRLTGSGSKCLIAHDSKVLHPASQRSKSLVYHQVKNRWLFILKNYSWRTLFLISPALIFYEAALFTFLLITGHLKEYLLAVNAIIQNMPRTFRKRRQFFTVKKVTDDVLLRSGYFLGTQFIVKNKYLKMGVTFFNAVVDKYWVIVKRFV